MMGGIKLTTLLIHCDLNKFADMISTLHFLVLICSQLSVYTNLVSLICTVTERTTILHVRLPLNDWMTFSSDRRVLWTNKKCVFSRNANRNIFWPQRSEFTGGSAHSAHALCLPLCGECLNMLIWAVCELCTKSKSWRKVARARIYHIVEIGRTQVYGHIWNSMYVKKIVKRQYNINARMQRCTSESLGAD